MNEVELAERIQAVRERLDLIEEAASPGSAVPGSATANGTPPSHNGHTPTRTAPDDEPEHDSGPRAAPANIASELVHGVVAPAIGATTGSTSPPRPDVVASPGEADPAAGPAPGPAEPDPEPPSPAVSPATSPCKTAAAAPVRAPGAVRYTADEITSILSGRKPTAE